MVRIYFQIKKKKKKKKNPKKKMRGKKNGFFPPPPPPLQDENSNMCAVTLYVVKPVKWNLTPFHTSFAGVIIKVHHERLSVFDLYPFTFQQ